MYMSTQCSLVVATGKKKIVKDYIYKVDLSNKLAPEHI